MTTENTDKGQTPTEADSQGHCALGDGSVWDDIAKLKRATAHDMGVFRAASEYCANHNGDSSVVVAVLSMQRAIARIEERMHWWVTNAENIAKERGELFRAGESLRAFVGSHFGRGEEVDAWDSAAQPMRNMIAAWSSPNADDEPRGRQHSQP